jgi:hypothetical protein
MTKRRGGRTGGFAEADGAAYVADTRLENVGNNLDLAPYEDVIEEAVAAAFEPEPAYHRSVEALEDEIRRRVNMNDGEDGWAGIPIEYLAPMMREVNRRIEERMKSEQP